MESCGAFSVGVCSRLPSHQLERRQAIEALEPCQARKDLQIWKFNRQARTVSAGATLRIQDPTRFRLRWSLDDWHASTDSESPTTALGIHYADIVVPDAQRAAVRFTFFWSGAERWEGRDFQVQVEQRSR